jgi:hypothetical protein
MCAVGFPDFDTQKTIDLMGRYLERFSVDMNRKRGRSALAGNRRGADNAVVVVNLTWRLTGPLAQFNRSGLIQDIVRRLAATFALNLEASIDNRAPAAGRLPGHQRFWVTLVDYQCPVVREVRNSNAHRP